MLRMENRFLTILGVTVYLSDSKSAPFDCSQEVVLPLYILGALIVVKVMIPNPNFPAIMTQRHEEDIFELFNGYKNNTIAVVPNSTETLVSINLKISTDSHCQCVESSINIFVMKNSSYISTYITKIIVYFMF